MCGPWVPGDVVCEAVVSEWDEVEGLAKMAGLVVGVVLEIANEGAAV
jgi:hypothetical protein